ncbi:hypothetical protein Agub_g13280 [Astrephomene gubernaculifera]|uniref:Protein-serine/threonine kinase n=1 Tax=Astrephomene gubernaculifera TaxID=47775 RepID=A0AAD3HSH3_9CHLO|nr:hypothetical protein Agub_g13280 [Astrephomene gubernaculifera]
MAQLLSFLFQSHLSGAAVIPAISVSAAHSMAGSALRSARRLHSTACPLAEHAWASQQTRCEHVRQMQTATEGSAAQPSACTGAPNQRQQLASLNGIIPLSQGAAVQVQADAIPAPPGLTGYSLPSLHHDLSQAQRRAQYTSSSLRASTNASSPLGAHGAAARWPQLQAHFLTPDGSLDRSCRRYQTLTPTLQADIQASALKKQTGVSLKYLLDFGTQPLERQMLLSARFLHSELPVRLAHRLMDLNNLPQKLTNEPHVKRVKGWYAESFADFRAFPPIKDNVDVVKFTAMLRNAFRRHNNVVPAIAKGVEVYKRELERTGESSQERESEIQHFLDTFFLSRIAIRFLAGQHISMFEPPRPEHIGLVHTKCNPFLVASEAVSEARSICFREYGGAPNVTVLGNSDLTMAYVPSHLHHMVFELVKNSLRAVQERFGDSDDEPPPIVVVVAEGLEDVTIKVSDQGGGIPRSGLQRIWTYLYTTARSPLPEVDIDTSNMPAVLAGYGCGLPLSRLYARYFGGDLQIISMEGYGTDAYLHLARLGNDEEPLPGAV